MNDYATKVIYAILRANAIKEQKQQQMEKQKQQQMEKLEQQLINDLVDDFEAVNE